MDQWVTDKFYSHFPSYSGEKSRRELLDKDRHDEYNLYLSRLASAENAFTSRNVATSKREQAERDALRSASKAPSEVLTKRNSNDLSERDMSLWNENMDLPGIFNEEIIKHRNRRVVEERHYKNLQYQRELKEQIEQKRKEAEERKAREIEAEERLTRKVEAQLRSVRLQDEIEKAALARKRDYRNLQSDLAISPKHNKYQMPMSTRSMSKSPRPNRHIERCDELERGKENLATASRADDADIYKYFTNSARDPIDLRNLNFRSHPDVGNEVNMSGTMDSHRRRTYPMATNRNVNAHQQCTRCELVVNRDVCNFCQQNRYLARSQYQNCPAHDRQPRLCESCYYQSICACCREELCARCNRPTKMVAKTKTDPNQSPRRRKLSPRATNLALLDESYEDSSDNEEDDNHNIHTPSPMNSPKKVQPKAKPYSFNIGESSMFHPSNSGIEPPTTVRANKSRLTDDLKRITDEKLSKYAKNYGDMRTRNTSRSKMIEMDPYPMPLLAQHTSNRKTHETNADHSEESGDNSFAFRQLESRWQIPFTQTNTVVAATNDKQILTLTQSGAFKKQLQMDKFNFGFERSDDDDS